MKPEELLIIVKENDILFGAAGALFMLLLGYRLAKIDSKRQETNAISQPIFMNLNDQLKCAEGGSYPQCGISDTEFHLLGQHLNLISRFRFSKALEKFKKAQSSCGEYDDNGRYVFHRPEVLINSIKELKKYAEPR